MAKAYAQMGCKLVLLARRIERLEELKKELETEVLTIKCDVTNTEDNNSSAQLAEKTFKRVDIFS